MPSTPSTTSTRRNSRDETVYSAALDVEKAGATISSPSPNPNTNTPPTLAALTSAVTSEWPLAPFNPHNWSARKRQFQVFMPTLFGFVCTFGSSAITPGVPLIAAEFGVSLTAAELCLSLYVLGLAFGPILAAPLSEHLGRRAVYVGTFAASCLLNAGTGLSRTFYSLLICRFFAGFFSGPALALGSGTIADTSLPIERALRTAMFAGSAFFGPLVGPLISGFVIERKGWRWSAWLVLMWAVPAALVIALSSETYRPTIIAREARRRAREAGVDVSAKTTDENQQTALSRTTSREAAVAGYRKTINLLARTVGRPLYLLFTEPILFCFSLYIAFSFGVFYGFFGAFPVVFQGIYGFSTGSAGLAWLGLIVGLFAALAVIVACDAWIYKPRHQRAAIANDGKAGPTHIDPENRLYPPIICCLGMPIALFWFGWTARADIHWISPIVASAFFTLGNFGVFAGSIIYLTDTYGPTLGASAMAANGLARYLTGCGFPLFSRAMYLRLGVGWASSLFGFLALALCAVPLIFFKYGKRIRTMSGRMEMGK